MPSPCIHDMALTSEDLHRIASLCKLSFDQPQSQALLAQINSFFELVKRMEAVDTSGVEPLFHPVSAIEDIQLRLQPDVADARSQREGNMQNAPAAEDGFFLVPKVIE